MVEEPRSGGRPELVKDLSSAGGLKFLGSECRLDIEVSNTGTGYVILDIDTLFYIFYIYKVG